MSDDQNNHGGGDWQQSPPSQPQQPGSERQKWPNPVADQPQQPQQPAGGPGGADGWANQPGQAQPDQAQQPGQQFGPGPQQPQNQQLQQTPPQKGTKQKLETDDIVPIVLSLIFPGVGQMMAGQTAKGIAILAVALFTCGFGGILNVLVALDVYCLVMTKKYRAVGDWEFLADMNEHF